MMVRFIFNLKSFVFFVLTASSKLNKKDQWFVITSLHLHCGMWSFCKVLECHWSTSLPWKGLSHTSPWKSTQSIQCEVVCQYIILTSSLPLSAGDHNHSNYLVSVHEMYLGCVCHFPTDLAWTTACYTRAFACAFNDNYWAVDRKSTQWPEKIVITKTS